MRRLEIAGRFDGWAFRKKDSTTWVLAADYSECICSKLEYLQQTTNLIDSLCDVQNDFGMQCLGRRFFDTECSVSIRRWQSWTLNSSVGGQVTEPREADLCTGPWCILTPISGI